MSQEGAKLSFKVVSRLVKYEDSVTQEDINNGSALPLEVVEIDDTALMTKEEAEEMGFKIDKEESV